MVVCICNFTLTIVILVYHLLEAQNLLVFSTKCLIKGSVYIGVQRGTGNSKSGAHDIDPARKGKIANVPFKDVVNKNRRPTNHISQHSDK